MPDLLLTKREGESKAVRACRYVVMRVCNDANLAFYMLHTEALRFLVEGLCEGTGQSDQDIFNEIKLRTEGLTGKAAIAEERARCSELEEQIQKLEARDHRLLTEFPDAEQRKLLLRDGRAIWKIEEMLYLAELGIEPLDHEKVRDVLNDRFKEA